MNDDIPKAKIRMLKSSLKCFVYGLLGLFPVISIGFAIITLAGGGSFWFVFLFLYLPPAVGLPFAIAALWFSGRARAREKLFWNAAKPYRIWGVACAALGAVLGSGILAIVIIRAWMSAQGID